jgi:hypothetical protein
MLAVGRKTTEPHAMGKVLTEKPIRVDTIEAVLGKIWCSLKGMGCKDLGKNRFMSTFKQIDCGEEKNHGRRPMDDWKQ